MYVRHVLINFVSCSVCFNKSYNLCMLYYILTILFVCNTSCICSYMFSYMMYAFQCVLLYLVYVSICFNYALYIFVYALYMFFVFLYRFVYFQIRLWMLYDVIYVLIDLCICLCTVQYILYFFSFSNTF